MNVLITRYAAILMVSILGAFGMASCGVPPPVDAQAAVQEACSNPDARESFDAGIEIDGPGRSIEYGIRVSGDDYHIAGNIRISTESGLSPYDGKFEIIEHESIYYTKEADQGWQIVSGEDPGLFLTQFGDLCPDLSQNPIRSLGEDTIDGKSVRRFSASTSNPQGSIDGGPDIQYTWDFWIEPSGLLVRSRVVSTHQSNGSSGTRAGSGGSADATTSITITSTISSIGEPNVITAPTIP